MRLRLEQWNAGSGQLLDISYSSGDLYIGQLECKWDDWRDARDNLHLQLLNSPPPVISTLGLVTGW